MHLSRHLGGLVAGMLLLTACSGGGGGGGGVSGGGGGGLVGDVTANGDISAAVAQFQANLGNPNNGVGGTFASGRREINWDGVPGGVTNTNTFPFQFFNTTSPRGAVLSTPGTGLRVSDVDFSDVDASYGARFNAFSVPKTFAAVGSNVVDVTFFVPGTGTPAVVNGFGAVFSDVLVPGATRIEYFDAVGLGLGTVIVPVNAGDANRFSFAGRTFASPVVARVRLTLGQAALGAGVLDVADGGASDLVVVDDFLYGEPQAAAFRAIPATGSIAEAVNVFRQDLGEPNNGVGGTFAAGRREINWDGVPGGFTNTTTFPGDFFNTTSPRGFFFTTPGTGFTVRDDNFLGVDASYAGEFNFFSPIRTFSPVGFNTTDVTFFIPGTATVAQTRGFGAVFSDVEIPGSTRLEFFDGVGNSLGQFLVPIRTDGAGLSFLGAIFATPVRRVRITSGQAAPGPGVIDISDGGGVDVVIMDDFLTSEPQVP